MSQEIEDTRIQALMEEQQKIQVVHEQRLTQVETRMTTLEIKFPYLERNIDKLSTLVDLQTQQGTRIQEVVVALKDGQEQHAKNIEEIKREQVTIGNISATLKSRIDMLWRGVGVVGTAIAIATVGYLFSLLVNKP